MSARGGEYVRGRYGVPARTGGRVRFSDPNDPAGPREGTIVAFVGPHLSVRFDDEPRTTYRLHPTWMVEYLG